MIRLIKKLFPDSQAPESNQPGTDDIHVICIALLVATANADHTLEAEEIARIEQLAQQKWAKDAEHGRWLLEEAHKRQADATSLYEFTSLINTHLSPEEKYQLVLAMWEIAYADGELDRYEEHIIRRVADLIYVEHGQFMQAKHQAQSID